MTRNSAPAQQTATVAVEPSYRRYGAWIGLPVAGGLLGCLVTLLAGWVAGLPWAPFQGPFELVASLPQPHGTLAVAGFGMVAGLGFASYMATDRLAVSVTAEGVELRRGRRPAQTIDGTCVRTAFAGGGTLVLLDDDGDELAHEATAIPVHTLREAFRAHGYRWSQGDPHAGEYRLWAEDDPDVAVRANSLLRTRKHALAKRHGAEAAQLRAELARAGYLVHDRKKQQYWRPRPNRADG